MALTYSQNVFQDIALFELRGKITSESDLEQLVQETASKSKIIFNLRQLEQTNSTGINFMIRTLTRCRINGGELLITGLGGNVEKLFQLAKIDSLFTVKVSDDDAINYFQQSN
ncbi:MAG: STAS domain-containing protein [Bacteroidota bacterium]|jgi:anti-anti-sigma factor